MTKEKHEKGKVLLIGGGIANFTNVAATFKGIVKALQEYNQKLIEYNVSIYVRRGGPNYQEGLRVMRDAGNSLNLPIYVFGPETHMTAIVGMALGKRDIPVKPESMPQTTTANFLLPSNNYSENIDEKSRSSSNASGDQSSRAGSANRELNDYVSISKDDV